MKLGLGGMLVIIITGIIIGVLLNMQISGVEAQQQYVPAKTSYQIEMEYKQEKEEQERKDKEAAFSLYLWMMIKGGLVIIVLLGGFAAIAHFWIIPARKNAITFFPDESGRLPVVREKVRDDEAPLWRQIFMGATKVLENDLELAMAPSREYRTNGGLRVKADLHGIDVPTQARYAMKQLDTGKITAANAKGTIQKMVAPRGKSRAELEHEAGVYQERAQNERIRGEIGKLTLQQRLQQISAGSQPLLPMTDEIPQYEEMNFWKSMNMSRTWDHKKAEIIIGQARDDAGADAGTLAKLNIIANPMIMVSGKPNSGKTKGVAFTIVSAAVQWQWSVVVFEPKNKRDWQQKFGGHVAYHEMNKDNYKAHLEMMEQEYERRSALLTKHGYIDWNSSAESAALCPPMLIVLEEFGTTLKRMRSMQEGEKKNDGQNRSNIFLSRLTSLVLESRASGMMFLVVQQRPSDYPSDFLSSFKHVVHVLEGMGQGIVVNSPKNHLLLEQGNFDMNVISRKRSGEPIFFWSFDTSNDIDEFLAGLPPTPNHDLMPNGCCDKVETEEKKTGKQGNTRYKIQDIDPGDVTIDLQATEVEEDDDYRQPITELPIPLRKIYEKDKDKKRGKWLEFARKWRNIYPDGQIISLAEAMCLAERGNLDLETVNARKSQAKKYLDLVDAAIAAKT